MPVSTASTAVAPVSASTAVAPVSASAASAPVQASISITTRVNPVPVVKPTTTEFIKSAAYAEFDVNISGDGIYNTVRAVLYINDTKTPFKIDKKEFSLGYNFDREVTFRMPSIPELCKASCNDSTKFYLQLTVDNNVVSGFSNAFTLSGLTSECNAIASETTRRVSAAVEVTRVANENVQKAIDNLAAKKKELEQATAEEQLSVQEVAAAEAALGPAYNAVHRAPIEATEALQKSGYDNATRELWAQKKSVIEQALAQALATAKAARDRHHQISITIINGKGVVDRAQQEVGWAREAVDAAKRAESAARMPTTGIGQGQVGGPIQVRGPVQVTRQQGKRGGARRKHKTARTHKASRTHKARRKQKTTRR